MTESTTASNSMYQIQSVEGKGMGLVATRTIRPGTLLIAESPIMKIDKDDNPQLHNSKFVEDHLRQMGGYDTFMGLHNAFPDLPTIFGIFKTNNIRISEPDQTRMLRTEAGSDKIDQSKWALIFPTISRLNHDCAPNAMLSWDSVNEKAQVYIIQQVNTGSEITIAYNTYSAECRNWHLLQDFNFECRCQICLRPPPRRNRKASRAVDRVAVLNELDRLENKFNKAPFGCWNVHPALWMSELWKRHKLLTFLGIRDERLAAVYFDAMRLASEHGDMRRARAFAEKWYAVQAHCFGSDKFKEQDRDRRVDELISAEQNALSNEWANSDEDQPKKYHWLWTRRDRMMR